MSPSWLVVLCVSVLAAAAVAAPPVSWEIPDENRPALADPKILASLQRSKRQSKTLKAGEVGYRLADNAYKAYQSGKIIREENQKTAARVEQNAYRAPEKGYNYAQKATNDMRREQSKYSKPSIADQYYANTGELRPW